jgi:transcriptional regulator of heat shock response
VLAEQPEFHSGERLRGLIELTEQRELLKLGARRARSGATGLQITIGGEHRTRHWRLHRGHLRVPGEELARV